MNNINKVNVEALFKLLKFMFLFIDYLRRNSSLEVCYDQYGLKEITVKIQIKGTVQTPSKTKKT